MTAPICPACQHVVNLGEMPSNREITCPACGSAFRVANQADFAAGRPPAHPLETGIEDLASAQRRGFAHELDDIDVDASPSKWRLTIFGLKLAWWSTLFYFLSCVGPSVVQIVAPMAPNDNDMLHPYMLAFYLSMGTIFVTSLAIFVSVAICCSAPDATARRYALTTVVATIAAVVLTMAFGMVLGIQVAADAGNLAAGQAPDIMAIIMSGGGTLIVMGILIVLLGLICYSAWFLFHAAVANVFGDRPLRRLAILNIILWPPLTALATAVAALSGSKVGLDDLTMARVQAGAGIILTSVTYGLYLLLCSRTIATIQRASFPRQ